MTGFDAQGAIHTTAIAGLILAIASWVTLGGWVLLPILGAAFSGMALADSRRRIIPASARGIAIAGLLLSLIALPLYPWRTLAFVGREADRMSCAMNTKQICMGLLQYSQDYDERLPLPDADWTTAIEPYLKNPVIFTCPGSRKVPGYQFAPALRGRLLRDPASNQPSFPWDTVMVFDSDDGETVAWRHNGYATFGYINGAVDWERSETAPRGYGETAASVP